MKWQILLLFLVLAMPIVSATEMGTMSEDDKELFDEILKPVSKIYNLVKYLATTLAMMVLMFAGISYMVSGSDPRKREQSKNMAMYVIIGLVVIWASPLVVEFLVA